MLTIKVSTKKAWCFIFIYFIWLKIKGRPISIILSFFSHFRAFLHMLLNKKKEKSAIKRAKNFIINIPLRVLAIMELGNGLHSV